MSLLPSHVGRVKYEYRVGNKNTRSISETPRKILEKHSSVFIKKWNFLINAEIFEGRNKLPKNNFFFFYITHRIAKDSIEFDFNCSSYFY